MLKLAAVLAIGICFAGLILGEVAPLIAGILSLALIILAAAGSGSDEPTTPP